MEKFRFISEITVYINKNNLYIASPDDKTCISKVKKQISDSGLNILSCLELTVSPENFKIRLSDDFELIVSSESLPGGLSMEYNVVNVDITNRYLSELLKYANFNKGYWDDIFEVAINDSLGKVLFLCPSMPSFKTASDEMIRRMNCKIYKKTKKFIPGHRYDTEDTTIYYLGKVFTNKVLTEGKKLSAIDYSVCPIIETHLFTKDIKFATKISEVLNNGIFISPLQDKFHINIDNFYSIYDSPVLKSMVDSGKVLEDDFTEIEDYIEPILNNVTRLSSDIDFRAYLQTFTYHNTTTKITFTSSILSNVEDLIKKNLLNCLYKFWDIPSNNGIKPEDSKKEQVESLCSLFINSISDPNLKRVSYYRALLSGLGLDLIKLAEDVLSSWDPNVLKDFNIYFDNYKTRGNIYNSQLRTEKSCRYKLTTIKVSDLIVNNDLRDSIKEVISYVRDNQGYGSSYYEIVNTGTIGKPLLYELITIDVKDIINYHKEKGIEVPENLKYSIIEDKLHQITISVDLGGEII